MLVRLTLICCGASAASRRGFFPSDEPLEPKAVTAAARLARLVDPADRFLTAPPARRARQTAEALGLDAVETPALRDQHYGGWAGLAFEAVERVALEAAQGWLTDPDTSPPEGEPFSAVAARVSDLLDSLVAQPGHTVAITHATVVRAAILHVAACRLPPHRCRAAQPHRPAQRRPPLDVAVMRFDGAEAQARLSIPVPRDRLFY